MRLELETPAIDLAPGTQVVVGARVVNDGPEPIDVVLGIAGLDNDGIRPVAELGIIPPGSSAVTTLHFALPKGAVAGVRDVAIHADDRSAAARRTGRPAAQRRPDESRRTERLSIRVLSTERLSLALQRTEVRGRFGAKLRADLRNQGDESLTVHLWGEGDDVTVSFPRDVITLPPGHSTRVKGRVRIPGVALRGEQRRAFVVTAQGASTPSTTSASYVQRGVLPASLFTLIALLVVLALWVTGLIYVQSRLRDDGGDAGAAVATSTTTAGEGTVPGGVPGSTPGGGTGPDAGPGGTPGGPDGTVPPGGGSGGATVVPVSIIGAVDGPASRAGTSVVLDLLSSGPSQAGSGIATKVAAFTSVREVSAPVSATQRTSTDDNGRFRFDNITQVPGLYRLTLFRAGFDVASQVVNVDGSQPNIDLAIKLSPAAGVLGGRASDGAGAALGGVSVTVTSGDLRYATSTADGTGEWRIDGVSTPATYVIQFAKPGFAAASLVQALDGGDAFTGLQVTMREGLGSIRGQVVVGLEGVGGLKVSLTDGTRSLVTTTRTDDPVGLFEFPGIPLGIYSLTIEGDGWQPSAREVRLTSGLEDLGTITDLLRSTATIRGIVTQEAVTTDSSTCVVPLSPGLPGASQQPCGGVGITASQGSTSFRTTSASGDGSFLLAGIPPGTYTLTFERFGYTSVVFAATVLLGDNLTVEPVRMFVLPRNLEASGRLRLTISSIDPLLALTGTAEVLGQVNDPTPFTGPANDQIDLTVPDLYPGSYRVRVVADGHDELFVPVQIPLNAETDPYDVVLTPLGTVAGRVTDTIVGSPTAGVSGAVVFLTPVADPNGRLLIPPPGTPVNPSPEYLRADPDVGEVRLCEKDVAAPGSAAEFVLGLCTRADASGNYRFANTVRAGDYVVSAPRNEIGGVGSELPLDHLATTLAITTSLNQTTTADLPLQRFGAVVVNLRAVDPATGTTASPLDGVTVTAFFCEPAATPLGCVYPPSGGAFSVPRGRVNDAAVGTVRIDRLAPAGFDPTTQVEVADYLLRFERDGFVDELLRVDAPPLDTDATENVVMLPKPTKVSITPFWTKAGTAGALPVPGVSVQFSGIVDYTNADPPLPITGTVTDSIPGVGGEFDSGDTVFLAGPVEVVVTAAGFTTVTTFVSLDPSTASGVEIEDLAVDLDPTNSDRLLAAARVKVPAAPRAVSGTLSVVCCDLTATFVPTNVDQVHDALIARLTLTTDALVAQTAPLSPIGAYTFSGVVPGDYTLTFEVVTNSIDLDGNIALPSTTVDVVITANTVVPTQKAVLESATLSGTITDIDDTVPLEGATVLIEGTSTSTVTDAAGFYSLVVRDVPGPVSLRISKADDRDDCLAGPTSLNPGASADFDVECAGPRGTIRGEVLGRDNAAATPTGLGGVDVVIKRVGSSDVFRSTTTESDGSFEFLDVPAGTTGSRDYVLEVSKEAYDPVPSQLVTVRPRQVSDPSITLTASTRPAPVLVRSATLHNGSVVPLGGVTVTATRSDFDDVSGVTSAAGTVSLSLAPGTWTLTTTGGAVATALSLTAPHLDGGGSVVVPVGTGPIDSTTITLDGPFATVSGTVLGQLNPGTAPAPLAGATVEITTAFGSVDIVTATGAYEFDTSVPVGFAAATAATVVARATGYVTSPARAETIVLAATPTTTPLADIVLAATAQSALVEVKGRESSAALQDVLVTAVLVGHPATTAQGTTAANGRTTLTLVPGTWTLTTSNGAGARAGGVSSPHGDVIGTVVVAFNTAPDMTELRPAALVAVSGDVRSVPTGDVGTFPARALDGASIAITRVGTTTPAEPVNSFTATSSGGSFTVAGGLTPGTWEIVATAAGHDPTTISVTVVAATPVSDADLDLDEQPMQLSGTVFAAGDVGVQGVTVTFRSGSAVGSVLTGVGGTYAVELAASQEWEVAFDPSTAVALGQDIPVLYRYVGTVQGGTVVVLDHRLFTDVVALTVTVKGVLPTLCDQTSCVEHDLGVAATVTLTDNGNVAPGGQTAFVEFDPIDTSTSGGSQRAVFGEVPNLSNYALTVSAPGYAPTELDPLDLTTPPVEYQCSPAAAATRCITVRLNALPRDVTVTVTDLAGSVVQGAQVLIRSKPPSTAVSLSCSSATDSSGVCTVPGVQPAFSPYDIYELVVNPGTAVTRGQYVQDLSVPVGVGAFAVDVTAVPIRPVVTTQPVGATKWAGESASFTAVASGRPAPSVTWEEAPPGGAFVAITDGVNTTPDAGAGTTTSTLTVDPVPVGKNGYRYRAVFTNQDGPASTVSTATTNEAVLTTAALVAATPVDRLAFKGDNVPFVAQSTGANTTVQWQRLTSPTGTWTNVGSGGGFSVSTSSASGTTTSTLTRANVPEGDSGHRFRAVFTLGAAGTRTSREATLTVADDNPPDPADVTAWAGSNATFSITLVTGLTVQWQFKPSGGAFTNLPNAAVPGTSATSSVSGGSTIHTLTVPTTTGLNGFDFRARVTAPDTGTTKNTSAADLTVKTVTNPADTTVWSDGTATLAVTVTPGGGFSVAWERNTGSGFAVVSGLTGASVDLTGAGLIAGQYRAVLTLTAGGTYTTSAATVTVAALPTGPASATVWASDAATFTVVVPAGATVQWRYAESSGGFSNLPNAAVPNTSGTTSTTLTVPAVTTGLNGYRFQAAVTLGGVARSSAIGTLTVASITAQPVSTSVVAGQNASFTATASGGATVQWQMALAGSPTVFVDIPAASNASAITTTLTLPAVVIEATGNRYRAVFTLAGASPATKTSAEATLTVTAS